MQPIDLVGFWTLLWEVFPSQLCNLSIKHDGGGKWSSEPKLRKPRNRFLSTLICEHVSEGFIILKYTNQTYVTTECYLHIVKPKWISLSRVKPFLFSVLLNIQLKILQITMKNEPQSCATKTKTAYFLQLTSYIGTHTSPVMSVWEQAS